MLQRYQRKSIEEELHVTRNQLRANFEQLASLQLDQHTPTDSAMLILKMINKLSVPILGMQVIRNDLAVMKYPLLPQYDSLLDKAELFYYQSIMQDLHKIKNQENVTHVNLAEVRQCIEQINWKLNAERSLVLNESQEIGDNVDLMKFFEGVRNYQNWQENIQKECFQRLKQQSHKIENQLTFQKGYLISRIDQIVKSRASNHQKEIFVIAHNSSKYHRLSKLVHRLQKRVKKDTFKVMMQLVLLPSPQTILKQLFKKYAVKKLRSLSQQTLLQIYQTKSNIRNLVGKIIPFERKKQSLLTYQAFHQLNLKPLLRAVKIGDAVKKTDHLLKLVAAKYIYKSLYLHVKPISHALISLKKSFELKAFRLLKQNFIEAKISRPSISNRTKGKVLLSFDKFKHQPLSLKQTFMIWHLNTHQNKFAKQMYNIWLQGSISKFTLFMRLKNVVDQVKKQKISRQLKQFLKILCEKYVKYQHHTSKNYFSRWIDQTRRIRKIQRMFMILFNVTDDTKQALSRYTFENINGYSKKKMNIKRYCLRFILLRVQNAKMAVKLWKAVPHLKKGKAITNLRIKIKALLDQINDSKTETLRVLKQDWMKGRQKKINVCRKAFSYDTLYLQRFMQRWRLNIVNHKAQTAQNRNSVNNEKKVYLQNVSSIFLHTVKMGIKDSLLKFRLLRLIQNKKRDYLSNKFFRIIANSTEADIRETLHLLKHSWSNGIQKKQRLVINLVHANVIKQKLTFYLFRSKSQELTQLAKRKAITHTFEAITEDISANYLMLDRKQFIFRTLQRILKNRSQKVRQSIGYWKAMPLRMRWHLRQKVAALHNKLTEIMNNRLTTCHSAFKSSILEGKGKQKKAIYIMACKFDLVKKRWIQRYRKIATNLLLQHRRNKVSAVFAQFNEGLYKNMSRMFLSPPTWPKKALLLSKLSDHFKRRISHVYKIWMANASALKYYTAVISEKKKRLLDVLNKAVYKNQQFEVKRCVELFSKNSRVHKLQLNFLKRLCNTQAGKLIKGFMTWKALPEAKNKERIVKATKFESKLSRLVIRNMKMTLGVMKDNHYFGNQAKKYCIRKLVAKSCSGISQYFSKWRLNKNLAILYSKSRMIEHLFQSIQNHQISSFSNFFHNGTEANKKRRSMMIVENWWNKQMKEHIKIWYRQVISLKMKDVAKKFQLKILASVSHSFRNRKLRNEVISKFVANRGEGLTLKKNNKSSHLIKVLQNYDLFKRTLLCETVDKLKYNHYKGNFQKSKAFQRFLNEKIGEIHEILTLWNNMANTAKQNHQRQTVTNNFQLLDRINAANLKLVFARTREVIIKKDALDRIFKCQSIRFKAYFNLWRQNLKELKMLGEMDKKTKAAILERINKIAMAASTQAVIEAIRKFKLNSKVTVVQRKFIERLMQTKSGKFIAAFQAWKTIPNSNLNAKYKKYQKFYFKLEHFYFNRLKQTHKKFTEENEDGNLMKKQSILKLFEMTSLGIRRYYNRWTRLTKETLILLSVNRTIRFMTGAEEAIHKRFQIAFKEREDYKVKCQAIKRLVESISQTKKNYIETWRQNALGMKRLRILQDKQKKESLLDLARIYTNSNWGEVIKAIEFMAKNSRMVRIQRAFFNKLMNTKTGKVIKFFQTLRTVPDAKLNKRKRKGIIFESSLNRFVLKRLRDTLNPLKECIYDANTKKRYCLDRLLRACMGENKKKFLIWRNVVREGKMLVHTALFDKIFSNLQNTAKENHNLLQRDTYVEMQKKKALCRKLLNNSLFVQHHAYLIWKQAYHVDDIKISKEQARVKSNLKNLINTYESQQKKKLVQTINVFRRILEMRNLEQFNYYKEYKNQKGLAFFQKLKKINSKNKSLFLDVLKVNQAEMLFSIKVKALEKIIQNMHNAATDNLKPLVASAKSTAVIEKAIHRLVNNALANKAKCFTLWRQHRQLSAQLQNKLADRKYSHLRMLLQVRNSFKHHQIVRIIGCFRQNMVRTRCIQQLLTRMVKNKIASYQNSFTNWKNIPYQQAKKTKNKASKFEFRLARLLQDHLRLTLNQLIDNKKEGADKKLNATRKIVSCKLLEMNHLFFGWRKKTNQIKVTQKIIMLDRVLSVSSEQVIKSFLIFDGIKKHDQRKVKGVSQLFTNNVLRLQDTFRMWRQHIRQNKHHQFERLMRNFNPQDYNKRLLKTAFLLIEKRKDLETMRGYINSLWKWKLSNIEATYYTKFIKVFRESEEMITFSTHINKKLYENVHHAFRNIMAVGHERTNRKREIVEKYLIRKARNYFLVFKNNTLRFEINIWKSKYTSSIKAKIISDVTNAIFLKAKYLTFNTIRNYYLYTKNIDQCADTINRYQAKNLKKAIDQIRLEGFNKLALRVEQVSAKTEQNSLKIHFNDLRQYANISRFSLTMMKIVNKYRKMEAFGCIRRRKDKTIKARFSLIMLATLINTSRQYKAKKAIKVINKNRLRKLGTQKVFKWYQNRYENHMRSLFNGATNIVQIVKLLERFQRGQAMKRILEKQDEFLKKQYLQRMRKRENEWLNKAIQMFATRSSIRSSMAVCLWRMKTYGLNS